jgi:hypothetical protein
MPQMLLSPKDATGKEITWRSAAGLDGYVRRLSALAVRACQQEEHAAWICARASPQHL